MAKNIGWFQPNATNLNLKFYCPKIDQQMTEMDLIKIIGDFDGWIAGDDPVNESILRAGKKGKLKSIVRWGIGMDNVDKVAAESLGYKIKNTPNVFGVDVAEVAIAYCLGLARHTYNIDRDVRNGRWIKRTGTTLFGKNVGILGFGDIGKEIAVRIQALGGKIRAVYDPFFSEDKRLPEISETKWPHCLQYLDFLILTAPLNKTTKHIINKSSIQKIKSGFNIVNVSRGGLINEYDLMKALDSGQCKSAALEVLETEPLPKNSPLLQYQNIIFGCHNASNTKEGILRATNAALKILIENFT